MIKSFKQPLIVALFIISSSAFADTDLSSTLSTTTGCTPSPNNMCTLTLTKAADFFNYATSCDQLVYWELYFYNTPESKITMTSGGGDHFCKISIVNTKVTPSRTLTCYLSATEVKEFTTPEAITALQNYDNTKVMTDETVKANFKTLYDCASANKASSSAIAPRFQTSRPSE